MSWHATVEVNALSRPIQTVSYVEPVPDTTRCYHPGWYGSAAFEEHILTPGEAPGTQPQWWPQPEDR